MKISKYTLTLNGSQKDNFEVLLEKCEYEKFASVFETDKVGISTKGGFVPTQFNFIFAYYIFEDNKSDWFLILANEDKID